jgi:hypothetical protein
MYIYTSNINMYYFIIISYFTIWNTKFATWFDNLNAKYMDLWSIQLPFVYGLVVHYKLLLFQILKIKIMFVHEMF